MVTIPGSETILLKDSSKRRLHGIQIQTASSCQGPCIICPCSTSWKVSNSGRMSDQVFQTVIDPEQRPSHRKNLPYLENEPVKEPKFLWDLQATRDNNVLGFIPLSKDALSPDEGHARLPAMLWLLAHDS